LPKEFNKDPDKIVVVDYKNELFLFKKSFFKYNIINEASNSNDVGCPISSHRSSSVSNQTIKRSIKLRII
jgi:hypothetical protein